MPFSATRDLWLVLKARDEGTRAMRSFSRDIRMVGDSVQQANLLGARSALRNQLALQRMTGASKADQLATMNRIQAVDQEINQSRIHRASLEESRVAAQKLSTTLGGASATMIALGTGMLAAGVVGSIGIKSMVDAAIDYQKQSNLTRTQVDKFAASLEEIGDIGLRVANKIGVPFQQIQPALFDIFSSLEVGTKEAEKLLETFAKAAVAGQTDIQSASRATIGILNAFQLPLTSVNHLMDLQFQLVQEGIGTYEEWTQRIGLVSPSAVRAGQSVEIMLAALAATTRQGISAARSGTAVARAFDAISNPKSVAALKALGVNALDSAGKFRSVIDILGDFRTALQKIPEKDKIGTILDVFKGAGGTIEARRFLQNMLLTPGNLEQFKSIFEEMSTESGSFEKAYAIMADSAATKSELLKNKWETLRIKAGEALIPTFLKVVSALGAVFDWFNKLDPKTQKIIATVLALATGLSIVGGIILLLLGTLAAFIAAVVVSGSALFVVVGILGGVAAALALFGAAIGIAYAKSAQFRGAISDTIDHLKELWQKAIVPTALAIRDAWEKYMQPAFSGLATLIETKVMPIFRQLQSFLQGEIIKAAIELGNTIKEGAILAFKALAAIIASVVIPAIEKLTVFYHAHEDTIKQIVSALVTFTKWLLKAGLIAGGILAVILAGPVIVAFLAVIGVIVGVIKIIVLLVDAVKAIIKWFGTEVPKAWGWLVQVAKNVWQSISDFFISLWENISNFFITVWNKIVAFWTSVTDTLASIWVEFWEGRVGKLLIAIWDLITSVINLGVTSMVFVVKWGLKILEDLWNWVWGNILLTITTIWNIIGPYIIAAWTAIKTAATVIWNGISAFFSMIWNGIKAAAFAVWTFLTQWLSQQWNTIVAIGRTAWTVLSNAIGGQLNSVWTAVQTVWNNIKSFFSGTGSWLFDAGKNLINGLIDGITSMIHKITGIIDGIAKSIKDHFPFSPAKIGPLSGKGSLFFAGQNLVKQLQDGISSKIGMVANVVSLAANATGGAPSMTAGVTTGRTYNQNITVNTQQINPRRQAAELGWLLQGRA